ncbi:hypothetical protein LEP3755_32810 [Leptolyngbya sp. NIES-3755]|nr:hypothetical protein LEP3755_32810 [Leptolyngbya sp. NIES-3755]
MLSMMTEEEQKYLYQFAKDHYVGEGAIVDLGCWLGASTIALAKGLQHSDRTEVRNSKIHSFDLFKWDASMDMFLNDTSLRFASGESFLEEYLKQIEPWKDQVQVYEGDLRDFPWQGGAIEFLFIDAMKSWELTTSIIRQYFGSLIPGRSIVYHQDYSFYGTFWIHLSMYRLRDYFEPIYDVPNAWGYVFRLKKAIPASLLSATYALEDYSIDEIEQAFEAAYQIVSFEKKSQIVGAKILVLMTLNETERARLELEKATANQLSVADLQIPLGLSFPFLIMQHCMQRIITSETQLHQNYQYFQTELAQASQEIQSLNAKISAMESSKFWQLRKQWFKLKRKMSLN